MSGTGAGISDSPEKNGFLLEFTLAKAETGMTISRFFREVSIDTLLYLPKLGEVS